MSRRLLPRELTIHTAADTHRALLAWVAGLGDARAWHVDASPVDETDGAGVQLLLSLSRSAAQAQATLHIETPSPALARACRTLGVAGTLLDIPADGRPA
ncbi:MAG: STAS domain-containing protein [Piscinibacter sp.]|nr:STAS domain-containing protein [Piscinibacter sp.]